MCEEVQHHSDGWVVVVTYGTRPFTVYVSCDDYENSLANRLIARQRGYRNPLIMSVDEYKERRRAYKSEFFERQMERKFKHAFGEKVGAAIAAKMRTERRQDAARGRANARRCPSSQCSDARPSL